MRLARAHSRLWSFLGFALALGAIQGRAQSKSSCSLLTANEVTAFLGQKPGQQDEGMACIYTVNGGQLELIVEWARLEPERRRVWEQERQDAPNGKGGVGRNEPVFGPEAYSTVGEDQNGRGSAFFLFRGSTLLQVIVIEKQPKGPPTSTAMLDKLRSLVKKAASRM